MFNLLHQNVFVVDDFTICPNRNNEISKIRWNMAISHSILSFSSTAMILCSSVMIFELIATLKVQQIFLKVEEQKNQAWRIFEHPCSMFGDPWFVVC